VEDREAALALAIVAVEVAVEAPIPYLHSMATPQAFKDIEENLSLLEDWEDRYRYLIELGQALPPLAPEEKTAANKIQGCVSQAWLVSKHAGETLTYRGESDAMIVHGLVAVLIALYSGRSAREIAETDAIAIFDRLGLREHLTTQRSNGLIAMVNRIRSEARELAA
jgi:cysteine desulfuration protein SufE